MQRLRLTFLILLAISILSACSSFSINSSNNSSQTDLSLEIVDGVNFDLLSPSSFGSTVSLSQSLNIKYEEAEYDLLTYLEIDQDQIVIVGLLPAGTRLFTITYDGATINSEGHSATLARIQPKYLIADLQFSMWPMETLKSQLQRLNNCFDNSQCGFEESLDQNSRLLSWQGENMIEVQQGGSWLEGDEILYQHFGRNYQISVLTFSASVE